MTLKTNKTKPKNKPLGFTIVELLIVIVIIAILAAITIVSYVGISKKATEAGLQSDLKGAKTKLELYKVEHGTYPTSVDGNNCPTAPVSDTNYCINKSIAYTPVGGSGLSYELVITKNNVSYQTTDSTPPFIINPITGIGAITGTPQVGQTLTAGAVTPAGATVGYQWQSSTTANGPYTDIVGATSSAYTLNPSHVGKYLKVIVIGTGGYSGDQTSVASSQVTVDANWITIGTQTWAKANLNVGDRVNGLLSQTNNSIIEKYCYNDDDSKCANYGALYQWDEAMQYVNTEGSQGICPAGSHVPSDNDWKILEVYLGMTQAQADIDGWRGTDQATKLKIGGASGMNIPIGGYRSDDGSYAWLDSYALLWSSSLSASSVRFRSLPAGDVTVIRSTVAKVRGYSIRCLAD